MTIIYSLFSLIIITQTELLISKDEFLKFHLIGKTRSITWNHPNFFDLAENNPYALGVVENIIYEFILLIEQNYDSRLESSLLDSQKDLVLI